MADLALHNSVLRDMAMLDRLPDRVLEEWSPAFIPRWNKYIPHVPTSRQWAFLLLDCKEALYGGQAGGGKSDALLMAALQYVDTPNYHAILFRRTYADLERPGALIPRSHEWLHDTDAHWNGRRWMFPSGAVLDFGYLDNANDVYRYQSSEYQFLGFDELTQFEEGWYRYLFSRARGARYSAAPVRVRDASNPGGIGHEWVRRRFFDDGFVNGRAFVPARLEDNPYLDIAEYDESMKELDPITYAQLRHGDWNVQAHGPFFDRKTIPLLDEPENKEGLIRMWDLAATKNQTSAWTAGALCSYRNGVFDVHEIRRMRGDPGEVEAFIRHTAEEDGRKVRIFMEQEPGSGGVNTIYRYRFAVLPGWTFEEYLPKLDKLTRAAPLSAHAKRGGVRFVRGRWNSVAFDEFEAFPNGFKDQVDTCSAAFQVLTHGSGMRVTLL